MAVGPAGLSAAGDYCAVLSEAETAAIGGAEHIFVEEIDRRHAREQLVAAVRQNLLLFLQLLLVALAMLASLRPGWESEKLDGDRFIFLVDNSASMSATDVDGAKNRLDEAKKLVGGLIDQMDSGMTAMLVSFADTPQVVRSSRIIAGYCASVCKRFSRACAAPICAARWSWPTGWRTRAECQSGKVTRRSMWSRPNRRRSIFSAMADSAMSKAFRWATSSRITFP